MRTRIDPVWLSSLMIQVWRLPAAFGCFIFLSTEWRGLEPNRLHLALGSELAIAFTVPVLPKVKQDAN
jgi:hypothetical protein